jgi:restriction system protein
LGVLVGRGSSSSSSYRQWEAAQRAQQRAQEQQRKVDARERAAGEARHRDEDAAARTRAVEQRIAELERLLRSSLARDPRVSLDSLRRRVAVPPLDLGELAIPVPAPEWADFEPEPVRGLRRMFGGQQQYEAAVDAARQEFQEAEEDHRRRENERSEQVADARRAYRRRVEEAEREVAAHNAHIDEVAAGLSENDRFAVSEYIQAVLDLSPYPAGFPAG